MHKRLYWSRSTEYIVPWYCTPVPIVGVRSPDHLQLYRYHVHCTGDRIAQRRKHKANESLKTYLSSVGLPTEQECTEGSFLVGNVRTSKRSRTLQCHCTSFCTFHQTGALFMFVTCDEVIVRWNVAEQFGESLYGDRRQRAHSRRSHEEGDATPKFVASGHLCYCAP